jgi:hypothetical protein
VHGCNCRNQFTLRFCVWLFPTADGKLFAWGRNSSGQLGLGKRAGKVVSTPRKVDCLADARVKMVALGSEHSIATTEEGEVLSWGAAGAGRLGHGHKTSILGFSITTSEYTPRLIKNLDGVKVLLDSMLAPDNSVSVLILCICTLARLKG